MFRIAVFLVPRAGVEPARIAPLVFETSASTDSAIWANAFRQKRVQRYAKKMDYTNLSLFFRQKSCLVGANVLLLSSLLSLCPPAIPFFLGGHSRKKVF